MSEITAWVILYDLREKIPDDKNVKDDPKDEVTVVKELVDERTENSNTYVF